MKVGAAEVLSRDACRCRQPGLVRLAVGWFPHGPTPFDLYESSKGEKQTSTGVFSWEILRGKEEKNR